MRESGFKLKEVKVYSRYQGEILYGESSDIGTGCPDKKVDAPTLEMFKDGLFGLEQLWGFEQPFLLEGVSARQCKGSVKTHTKNTYGITFHKMATPCDMESVTKWQYQVVSGKVFPVVTSP